MSKESPPNFQRAVVLPDCCGTCDNYLDRGSSYEDSPAECAKYKTPWWFAFEGLCDGYERSRNYPVSQIAR